MIIIPAIDLFEGTVVRLVQGDYAKKTVYSTDPLMVARDFEKKGATMLHLVDLEGAKDTTPKNLSLACAIANTVQIPVQFGGGIRSLTDVDRAIACGISRVIVGTAALEKPPWFLHALKKYQERIVVGIDALNGRVAVEGWRKTSKTEALLLALEMKELGVQEIIYTDIARDGMLMGPNFSALEKMGSAKMKLIASGGVTTREDILELKKRSSYGVYAAIVGKALYTGVLDFEGALEAAKGGF